jgi:hypothetical protein
MKPYAIFDRSEFPIITINFTGTSENESNFELYLSELEKNYTFQKEFSLIFELTKAPIPKLNYQLKQANWMKANEDNIKTYCRGVAYIIPSSIMRNILKFIFSVQKNPVPFSVFSTLEEGKLWAAERME